MNLSNDDHEWLIALMKEVSSEVILPHFRSLSEDDIKEKKDPSDLVTIADSKAETFITARLMDRFPQANIIGEEAVSDDPNLLKNANYEGLNFIIDPIDGTFNFANGVPLFSVILAVVQDGKTVTGFIYDPVMKDLLFAESGKGAYKIDEKGTKTKLKLSGAKPFEDMTGQISRHGAEEDLLKTLLVNQTKNAGCIDFRCGAQAFKIMLSAGIDYMIYPQTSPWDHLAGDLLIREAGGYTACFDGSPYGCKNIHDGLIIASSKEMWNVIKAELWA